MRRAFIAVCAVQLTAGCATQSSTMPTVMQGTAIVDAGLEMTVEGTTMRNTVGPTDFYGPWVIVMVLVVNYSDKPAYFNPMIQELLVNGDEFEPNPAVAESLDSETVSSASLLPGGAASVVLAFSIGKDAMAFTKQAGRLVVRGNLDSRGTTVELNGASRMCTARRSKQCDAST